MITRQARDLTGRDIGRTITCTDDITAREARNQVIEEILHGRSTTVLIVEDRTYSPINLYPQTQINITGHDHRTGNHA
ncbi:hypothetical protein [Zhihengliuella flava]|uniref:Uncharacterized protein n=1 Tax=Zhihengliuella flava TaxID=1285193 RepID=A0A931D2M8_9MICC|nr:hypothetical protein [Zhihengliuella flava]MBG6083264.1 hypothetical protein [Zhihengliuella flava]